MKRRDEGKPTRLRSWLVPTLIGPALGAALFVLVHALLTGAALLSVVTELVASGVIAAVLGLLLALVDFGLLAARLRKPPASGRAWLSAMTAGATCVLLWRLLRPSLISAPSSHLLAVGAALLVSAVLVRWLTSPKPGAWLRFS